MNQGITTTVKGRALLAKLIAGETLTLSRVMVGKGKLEDDTNPATLENLVEPVAQGTSTTPTVKDETVSLTVEYRSDLNGGLTNGFWLNEFGIYAIDPDDGEIMLIYANLGDFPQYVSKYNSNTVDVRRFPVSIAITDGANVNVTYSALGFMTSQEINYYITNYVIPDFEQRVIDLIAAHNIDPNAHPDIWTAIKQNSGKIKAIEDMYVADIKENAFEVDFADLDGLTVTGVWNKAAQRIEF